MPILNPTQILEPILPQYATALRVAGLLNNDRSKFDQQLESCGLGPVELFDTVSDVMRNSESNRDRLKAAEVGLRLNGLLAKDDSGITAPSVTIIIKDSQYTEVNPILIPRKES